MFGVVDGEEGVLDYWQRVYHKCQGDPAEARRLDGMDWVRDMPGMADRLGRA